MDKLVWATQKLQARMRKLVENARNRTVRRAEVVWRAGIEYLRGMAYATLAAGQLVADGVLEWTSMDGIFLFLLYFLLYIFIINFVGFFFF